MTGADAIHIARKALAWAEADQKRRASRERWKDGIKDGKLAAVIEIRHKAYTTAARSAGGYRRGLMSACLEVLSRGVDLRRTTE